MPPSWSPCRSLVLGALYGVASTPALELRMHCGCGRRPGPALQGTGMSRCHQGMPWSMFALHVITERQSSTGALLLSGMTRWICSNSAGFTR